MRLEVGDGVILTGLRYQFPVSQQVHMRFILRHVLPVGKIGLNGVKRTEQHSHSISHDGASLEVQDKNFPDICDKGPDDTHQCCSLPQIARTTSSLGLCSAFLGSPSSLLSARPEIPGYKMHKPIILKSKVGTSDAPLPYCRD